MIEDILKVARRLAQPFDRKEVLERIVDVSIELLRADRASVLLLDRERHELFSEATTAREAIRFPASTGIAGETLQTGRAVRIDDCYADARFNQDVDRKTGYRTETLLSIPLVGSDDRSVGVLQVLNSHNGAFSDDDERRAGMLASLAVLALDRAQAVEDRMRQVKIESDLLNARSIQMSLLPGDLPACPGYSLSTFFEPAEETGGDIYDVFPVRADDGGEPAAGELMVLLADATGHGISAAVSVTQVRSMLRMASRLEDDLDSFCQHLNSQLAADLPASKFVTAFVGVLDPVRNILDYHSLGQAPLLHYRRATEELIWLPASSVPMGLLPNPPLPRPEPIVLEPGDAFVLLSDGFYEYSDVGGEEMGNDRVGAAVTAARDGDADQIRANLIQTLREFAGDAPQEDDLTAVVLKRDEPDDQPSL